MGSGYWNMVPEPRKGRHREERIIKEEEKSMGSGYWNMVPEPRKGRQRREERRKT